MNVSAGSSSDQWGSAEDEPIQKQQPKEGEEESGLVVDRLCKFIYTNDKTNWIRTRAVLCQIFHLALHDRWFQVGGQNTPSYSFEKTKAIGSFFLTHHINFNFAIGFTGLSVRKITVGIAYLVWMPL